MGGKGVVQKIRPKQETGYSGRIPKGIPSGSVITSITFGKSPRRLNFGFYTLSYTQPYLFKEVLREAIRTLV